MMAQGFIKLTRGEETNELMRHPNAFALLALIACRAKRNGSFSSLGLEPGEALIGDHKFCGLTRQEYRTALKKLKKWGFITTKATNRGTVAKLLGSRVFNINMNGDNHPDNQTLTIRQPSSNHQATTNEEVKKEKKVKKKNEYPEWLDLNLWADFKKHRTKLKAPMTERAEGENIKNLEKIMAETGATQEEIVAKSIERGWKGFFPVRGKSDGNQDHDTGYVNAFVHGMDEQDNN